MISSFRLKISHLPATVPRESRKEFLATLLDRGTVKANLHKWLCNLKRFSYFCVVSDRRLCLSGNFQFINILAVVVDDKDGCRGRRLFLSDTKAGNKNNAYEVSYLCGVLQERGRL